MGTVLLLGACDASEEDEPDRNLPDALVPLEAGHQWVGEAQGDSVRATITSAGALEVTVEPAPDSSVTVPLEAERQSGGLLIRLDGEELFLFQYPAVDGDAYEYTDSEGNVFSVSVSRASVRVPAGFFECLRYTIEGAGGETRRACMRPGLGPIRLELPSTTVVDEGPIVLVSTNVEGVGGYP